jgi:hypothetical protein
MSQTFPNFSNVKGYIKGELDKRVDNPNYLSSLNVWVRVSSGVGEGLILMSNPDYKLLSAAGDDASIYGNDKTAGVIGKRGEVEQFMHPQDKDIDHLQLLMRLKYRKDRVDYRERHLSLLNVILKSRCKKLVSILCNQDTLYFLNGVGVR